MILFDQNYLIEMLNMHFNYSLINCISFNVPSHYGRRCLLFAISRGSTWLWFCVSENYNEYYTRRKHKHFLNNSFILNIVPICENNLIRNNHKTCVFSIQINSMCMCIHWCQNKLSNSFNSSRKPKLFLNFIKLIPNDSIIWFRKKKPV